MRFPGDVRRKAGLRGWLAAAMLAAGAVAGAAERTAAPEYMLGADVSWIPEQEAKGRSFSDGGVRKDILEILKEHRFNWIRLRLFNDPRATNGYSAAGFCDLDRTAAMILRARKAGMRVLLDFHYSDTWADPGHQRKPAAWKDLAPAALEAALRAYTRDTLRTLRTRGAAPDMVQTGNEVSHGFLWPDGKPPKWDGLAALLKAAIAGVRDAEPAMPVMLHLALGGQQAESRQFLDRIGERGVAFDVLGQSYYPKWHGTLDDLRANLADLATRYRKPIAVVEYSEHKREVNEIVRALPDRLGLGTCIWEPTGWGERLFDDQGRALPLLDLYPALAPAAPADR